MKEFKMVVPEDDEIKRMIIEHVFSLYKKGLGHPLSKFLYFHNQRFDSKDCEIYFGSCGFTQIDYRTFLSFELVKDELVMNIDKAQQLWIDYPSVLQRSQFVQMSGRIQNESSGFDQYKEHERITNDMSETYRAKNSDYGDSFHKSFEKYGAIAAIVRMDDKLSRAHQLLCEHTERKVRDETVIDTLTDLANYAIMTVIELKIKKFEENK